MPTLSHVPGPMSSSPLYGSPYGGPLNGNSFPKVSRPGWFECHSPFFTRFQGCVDWFLSNRCLVAWNAAPIDTRRELDSDYQSADIFFHDSTIHCFSATPVSSSSTFDLCKVSPPESDASPVWCIPSLYDLISTSELPPASVNISSSSRSVTKHTKFEIIQFGIHLPYFLPDSWPNPCPRGSMCFSTPL